MKIQKKFRNYFVAIIGNTLEHYDRALYGLLAPFIAPLFFPNHDPITALILAYIIPHLSLLTRPLGSLFFGRIGDCYGRRIALFYSLFGMALMTVGIGLIPTYATLGSWAPLLLALGRMAQSFFAAGETAGGAIFVLEHTEKQKRSFAGSLYDASSIGGILIASLLVAVLSRYHFVEQGWRLLFWAGSLTGILGLIFRLKGQESEEFKEVAQKKKEPLLTVLREHKAALISIAIVVAFSHATFAMSFTLMNGFVPLISSISAADLMSVNTLLLCADAILLPFFGLIANRIGKEKVMLAAALMTAILAFPLFSLLSGAMLLLVTLVRMIFLILGVAFAACYHAWAVDRVEAKDRYTILSLGSAIGSQLPTMTLSLWLYKVTGWAFAPGLYFMLIAAAAFYVVFRLVKQESSYTARE
jgi:MFS transporter, MHS family, proline/betaine transporter